MYHDDKKFSFEVTTIPMEQMNNEQIMVTVRLEQLQGLHREAKKNGTLPNHITKVLMRCKKCTHQWVSQKLTTKE